MWQRPVLIVVRLGFGLLTLVAIITQLTIHAGNGFDIVNFFSYFTLHYLMPVVVVAEWLFQPPKAMLSFQQSLYWLVYPLVYLVYSLIRGPISGFYAYPFLNPAKIGGYGIVALYCVGIFVLFLVIGAVLRYAGNRAPRNVA